MIITTELILTASLVAALIIGAATWAAATQDNSPTPLGLGGLVLSMVTAAWWPSMHVAVSITVIAIAATLYIIGLRADESVDKRWHIAALVVGATGRTVAFVAWFTAGWLGQSGAPRLLWPPAILGVVATILWLRQKVVARRLAATPVAAS